MRGRQPGRPTKWVYANVDQWFEVTRTGVSFEVWRKWKRKEQKLGTLVVSVGGLRWRPASGKYHRWRRWDKVADWLSD